MYLEHSARARAWAVANRDLCAHRTLDAIRGDGQRVLDICHNSVTVDGCQCWLHRKGAAPADQGPVIIPGSRGDLSYVVKPISDHALRSLAHGAGRKIGRGDAHGKLRRHIEILRQAYEDMVAAGLIQVIATVRPLVTFKTSEGANKEERRDRKQWQRERDQARAAKRR